MMILHVARRSPSSWVRLFRARRAACAVRLLAVLLTASASLSAQQPSPQPASAPGPPTAPQQGTAQGGPTGAPVTKPPLPNRLNSALPSWLRVRGEFRERVEGFENAGFNDERDDLYYLSRVRLNATATGRFLAVTVQGQDARVGKKTVGATGAPFKAALDLRMAYADLGSPKGPIVARVGRQELVYGDQRLVGHVGWLNAARTFDAAKVTFKSKTTQVDVFGASVVRILDGEFDRSGNGNRFAGAYATAGQVIPLGTIEPYAFWRRDRRLPAETGGTGSLSQLTTGVRLVGRMPARLDYNVEMDLQRGSLGTDDVRAWAGHWQVRASLPARMSPRVTGDYNFASGDESPTDGTRGTFDQLYPTGHEKYGLADQVGWRNIHDLHVGFDVTPFKATPITMNYHSYWLAETHDALYAASGAAVVRVAGGATSAKVGQEIDVQIARPLTPQLALLAGYSRMFAGPFLKEATPGKSYSGPFVMLTYVFLAER